MSDTRQQGIGERGRDRSRGEQRQESAAAEAAVEAGGTVQQTAAGMAERAARRGSEALQEGAQDAAGMVRRSAEAGRRGGEALGDAARRGLRATASGQQRLLQEMAEEVEQTGQRLALVTQEATEGMRSLMAMPGLNGDVLRDAQAAMARLMDGVVTTNLRLAQELLRRNGPSSMIALQRRFLRDYFDALAEGASEMLRVTRRAAEESLRPLERQARWRGDGVTGGGRVADVMSRDVRLVSPEDTVQQAARLMRDEDTGILPVGDGDRLVGMITDRDIAVRLAAEGRHPAQTRVREMMTPEVRYCFEDEPLEHVADNMAEQQLHRLPVVNREKRLVGIISLGDIARSRSDMAGRALHGISRPGGLHSQREEALQRA